MTVSKDNFKDVHKTIHLAKQLGAKDISVATVKPNGRGTLDLNMAQLIHISNQILRCENLIDDTFNIYTTEVTFFLYDLNKFSQLISKQHERSCAFGQNSLHIKTNGDILGCTACEIKLGNIFELSGKALNHFWGNDITLNAVRSKNKLLGLCQNCEYKKICGGCRCRAFGVYQNLFAEDPGCIKVLSEKSNIHA